MSTASPAAAIVAQARAEHAARRAATVKPERPAAVAALDTRRSTIAGWIDTLCSHRLHLLALGRLSKTPAAGSRGWPDLPAPSAAQAVAWLDLGGNVGVNLGRSGLIAWDADDATSAQALIDAGYRPHTISANAQNSNHPRGRYGGRHVLWRVPAAWGLSGDELTGAPVSIGDGRVDVLAGRHYVVLPPSVLDEENFVGTYADAGAWSDPIPELPVAFWPAEFRPADAPEPPRGLEALRGAVRRKTMSERVESDARSDALTAAVDAISWAQILDGEQRLAVDGEAGCGCPTWRWSTAANPGSLVTHDGCWLGDFGMIHSDSMALELGTEHKRAMSRLALHALLRGQEFRDSAAEFGIDLAPERTPLGVVDAAYYERLAATAEADAAAGRLRVAAAGEGGTTEWKQISRDELLARAAGYRSAAVAMRGEAATRPAPRGEVVTTGRVAGGLASVTPIQPVAGTGQQLAEVPVPTAAGAAPAVGVARRCGGGSAELPGPAAESIDALRLVHIDGHMPPPDAPLPVARELVRVLWTDDQGRLLLRRWRGDWIAYTGTQWMVVGKEQLRQAVYTALEHATIAPDGPALEPERWNPTARRVDSILDALTAVVLLPDEVAPHVGSVVALANGLLDLDTRHLQPHSPDHFAFTCLPYPYTPGAQPTALLAFLRSLWPDDPASIDLIQEWLGYMVSGATSRQKAMLLIGPPRSGKGTLLWLLQHLVGAANAAAPTLAALCSQFGLQALIGKTAALVGDARLSGSTSTTVLVERLLSITGEDELQVDRKYRDPWTGRLGVRFTIASNELPRFADASAAVVSRLLTLRMSTSFLGREDEGLRERLAAELPAILTWSLDGLDRLNRTGRFTRPVSSTEVEQELTDLASPTRAFLRDECVTESGAVTVKDSLYRAWTRWCADHGHQTGSAAWFARNLSACGITGGRESVGQRRKTFVGVRLLNPPVEPPVGLAGVVPLINTAGGTGRRPTG